MRSDLYTDLYQLEDLHWWHIAKRRHAQALIEQYLPPHLTILDLGCGTGKNVEVLSHNHNTFGLDMSPEAVKFCTDRRLKNIRVGDCLHTPYDKQSFDLITLFDVLEHVCDSKALVEVTRILRPSGFLLITVPAYQFLWSKWDEILHHQRRYTLNSLTDILEKNNYKVIKISYIYSFLLFPAYIIRIIKDRLYQSSNYPSDFKLSSPLINKILLAVCSLEIFLIKYISLPFGTSIICLARKQS